MFSVVAKRFTVLPGTNSRFFKFSSPVRFISTDSFVVSYLTENCGVSQQKAISANKLVHFESCKNPDKVITFLRENGFSNAHISKIIGAYPMLLISNVDKTLKPKFEFFKSQGITGSDLAGISCRHPNVLRSSLEKKIIPNFGLIRSIIHTDANLLAMLKRSPSILRGDPHKSFLPNVALLQAHGVPEDNIAKLLISQPRSFLLLPSRYREIVEEVKNMKFDPSKYMFLEAVQGLTSMTKSSLEGKFDVYMRWGLCKDEVLSIFRKKPQCLMISEKNIMSTMNYFVNEMGYTPSSIAKCPSVLTRSLTKSIIPRCSVIQILKEKGFVGNVRSLYSLLNPPEEVFLKKYVFKFEKEVPDLLSIYHRKCDEPMA